MYTINIFVYKVMTMSEVTLSARISEEMEKEIEEFMKKEKVDRSIAVRKLLDSGLRGWKEAAALKMLERGDVTFSKAAKIAHMDVWTFTNRVRESGITWIKMKPGELKKELAKI
jgi:predicted HTH domain antitoxin